LKIEWLTTLLGVQSHTLRNSPGRGQHVRAIGPGPSEVRTLRELFSDREAGGESPVPARFGAATLLVSFEACA